MASRWHHLTCTAADVAVFDGSFLWCGKCHSVFDPHSIESHVLPARLPPDAPTLQRQEMELSWPPSVQYLPESATCFTLPNKVHHEVPKDIVPDYDDPTVTESCTYGRLTSNDEIRILLLSNGNSEEPLHGTLVRVSLQNFADYEAMSYTWASYDYDEPGDGTIKKHVIYLGPFWDALPITRNCSKALYRLRYLDRIRILWVDSICINQENGKERGHQVGLMKMIYKNALSVVVYLGDENAGSSIALDALRKPERLLAPTVVERRAFAALFQRPYFSRLWIVQEIALAKSLHFYCGYSESFIPAFSGKTLESLLMLGETVPAWIKYSAMRESTEPRRLLSLLQDTNMCQCLDPRDKVFGVLSLTTADSEQQLKPDYNISVEEVYAGITAFLIREYGLLSVLRFAVRTPLSNSSRSWALNWETCTTNSPRWRPNRSQDRTLKFRRRHDKAITILNESGRDISSKGNRDYSSSISTMGTLIVEGILFAGWVSEVDGEKDKPLLLQNHDRTLKIHFRLRDYGYSSSKQHPIFNHEYILLLGPDYSDALVLAPVEGKEEFRLLSVGEISAGIYATVSTLRETLDILPFSAEKLVFCRRERIALLEEFDMDQLPWEETISDSEDLSVTDLRDTDLESMLEYLLSSDFLENYETETKLWARWQEFDRECMPIFFDLASMDSIANHIHSLKNSDDWNKIQQDSDIMYDVPECRITNFLSLFLFDPLKRSAASPSKTTKRDSSEKEVNRNDDPRLVLDRLLDWEICTLDLLKACTSQLYKDILGLPGSDLLKIARKTWTYHYDIGRIVSHRKPSWRGWYTWFTAKRIARQQLDTAASLRGEDFRSKSQKGTYWDWNHMRTTMEMRQGLMTELLKFRRRIERDADDISLDLLARDLETQKLIRILGDNVTDSTIRHRSVRIR